MLQIAILSTIKISVQSCPDDKAGHDCTVFSVRRHHVFSVADGQYGRNVWRVSTGIKKIVVAADINLSILARCTKRRRITQKKKKAVNIKLRYFIIRTLPIVPDDVPAWSKHVASI